jgi:hypothetical protein
MLPLSDRVIPIGTLLTGPSFIDIVAYLAYVLPYAACFDYIVTAAKTVLYQVLEDPATHQFSHKVKNASVFVLDACDIKIRERKLQ